MRKNKRVSKKMSSNRRGRTLTRIRKSTRTLPMAVVKKTVSKVMKKNKRMNMRIVTKMKVI